MKFTKKQAVGQAGEYLVGAVVTHRLAWPYRTQPITDLGVDGEIEVLDEAGVSLSGIIKVQAKATAKDDEDSAAPPFRRYVYPAHYEYWAALSLPVIVCRPVLATGKIYWLPASAGRTSGKMISFDFEACHELTAGSAGALRDLARREGEVFDILSGAAEVAQHRIADVLSTHTKEEYAAAFEGEFYAGFDAARKLALTVQGMDALFPSLVTDRAKACLANLRALDDELTRMKNWVDRNRRDLGAMEESQLQAWVVERIKNGTCATRLAIVRQSTRLMPPMRSQTFSRHSR